MRERDNNFYMDFEDNGFDSGMLGGYDGGITSLLAAQEAQRQAEATRLAQEAEQARQAQIQAQLMAEQRAYEEQAYRQAQARQEELRAQNAARLAAEQEAARQAQAEQQAQLAQAEQQRQIAAQQETQRQAETTAPQAPVNDYIASLPQPETTVEDITRIFDGSSRESVDRSPTEDASARDATIESLIKQIQARSDTSRWTGGYGADQATKDMARILAETGITDLSQFGPITREVEQYVGSDDSGNPIYEKQTERTFGNKLTGQAVPLTYSGRQTGNFFGGTFEGKGNTGYGVQFDAQGNPVFYTQGASSNDLANLIQDAGPIGQIALAVATGGLSIPQQIAAQMAVQVLSGADMGDVIKNTAINLAVAQIPGTDFMKEVGVEIKNLGLDPSIAKTLNNAAQNAATSATRAVLTGQDISDAVLRGAATGGVNAAVGEMIKSIPDFDKLTPNQQRMASNAITGVISGKPLDQILINSAIAAANAEIKANEPINAKELSQLEADEKRVYDESGTSGLRTYQQQISNLERLTTSGRTGDDMGGVYDTPADDIVESGMSSDILRNLENAGLTQNTVAEEIARLNNTEPQVVPETTKLAQENELLIAAKRQADEEASKNAEVSALNQSGLTPAELSGPSNDDILRMINAPADDTVTVTTPKGPDGDTDAERESKRILDLIAVGGDPNAIDGDPNSKTVFIDTKREPVEEPVSEPIFQTPVTPNAPNLGNLGEMVITTDRLPQSNLNLTTDPVALLTDPLAPTTLPTPVTKPAPAAKPDPFANIDPIQALQELYNPFKPAQSAKPPSQTDTGPIQLMTDIFGTDISKAQKAGARGYGFSAGGDIDELLRLLRR